MKEIAPDDRPREKLARLGAHALGDNELVALILGTGRAPLGALALANLLLADIGGPHRLTRLPLAELARTAGIGHVRAVRLLAAVELGRRTLLQPPAPRPQILTPAEAAAYLLPRHSARAVEHFGLLLLDVRYRVLRTALLSAGTADSTAVHPREVFREAAAGGASAVVLFHNHPSGDPAPSQDDVRLTARLVRAGEVMGIDVVDHLILADDRYFSFREAGGLPPLAAPR